MENELFTILPVVASLRWSRTTLGGARGATPAQARAAETEQRHEGPNPAALPGTTACALRCRWHDGKWTGGRSTNSCEEVDLFRRHDRLGFAWGRLRKADGRPRHPTSAPTSLGCRSSRQLPWFCVGLRATDGRPEA